MANPIAGVVILALFIVLPIAVSLVPPFVKLFKAAELYPMPQPGGLTAAVWQALLSLFSKRTKHLHPVVRQLRTILLESGYFCTIGLLVYIFFVKEHFPIVVDNYVVAEESGWYHLILTLFCMALIATGVPGALLAIGICVTLTVTNVMNCFYPFAAIIFFGPYVYVSTLKIIKVPEGQRGASNRIDRDWFRP